MTEPDRPAVIDRVTDALRVLGRDRGTRARLIEVLREIERAFPDRTVNLRDTVTGPIVDALFEDNELLDRTLANGATFSFRYTSKIARDFVMAADAPDHVWEPQTTKLLLKLAPTAASAVVAGAYFGDQAIPLAAAMRRSATCYAFEIDPLQVELLRINARDNGLENIVSVHKGLWSRSDVKLTPVGGDAYGSVAQAEPGAGGLDATSLNDFGAANRVDEIGILLLDIEGGELEVLEGADVYLAQAPERAPTVIFEVHRLYVDWSDGLDRTPIARLLEGHGYTLFAIRDYQGNVDMRGRPVELVPIRSAYLEGPPHGFNVLAIKDPRMIDRLDCRLVEGVSPKLLFHRDPRLHQPLS